MVADSISRDARADLDIILSIRSAATTNLEIPVEDNAGRWFAVQDRRGLRLPIPEISWDHEELQNRLVIRVIELRRMVSNIRPTTKIETKGEPGATLGKLGATLGKLGNFTVYA